MTKEIYEGRVLSEKGMKKFFPDEEDYFYVLKMSEFTEKHAAALEFLVSRFGTNTFSIKQGESFMHKSILKDLVELRVIEPAGNEGLYQISYEVYIRTFEKRNSGSISNK